MDAYSVHLKMIDEIHADALNCTATLNQTETDMKNGGSNVHRF